MSNKYWKLLSSLKETLTNIYLKISKEIRQIYFQNFNGGIVSSAIDGERCADAVCKFLE